MTFLFLILITYINAVLRVRKKVFIATMTIAIGIFLTGIAITFNLIDLGQYKNLFYQISYILYFVLFGILIFD